VAVALAVILTAAHPPVAAWAEPPEGCTLAWQDEFNQLSIGDPGSGARWLPYFARWGVRHLAANQDQAAKVADIEQTAHRQVVADVLEHAGFGSRQSGILARVTDGVLELRAFKLPAHLVPDFWGLPYVGAMVSGETAYAQRYGYWEVRLRLDNVSAGQHFAVWLLPKDGSWPPEIDMLEAVGQNSDAIFMNAHGQPAPMPITQVAAPLASHRWITVGFQWTTTTMRWTLDGKTVREQANFVDRQELYFLMSWEISDRWTGPTRPSTVWPAQVSVDYVRIYRIGEPTPP
jgi:hypothetical protein